MFVTREKTASKLKKIGQKETSDISVGGRDTARAGR